LTTRIHLPPLAIWIYQHERSSPAISADTSGYLIGNTVRQNFVFLNSQETDILFDHLCRGHSEHGMFFPQLYKSFVVIKDISVFLFVIPAYFIDFIRLVVTVMGTEFCP